MIERRVEAAAVLPVAERAIKLGEIALPLPPALVSQGIERLGVLRHKVGLGIVFRHAREGHPQGHLALVESKHCLAPVLGEFTAGGRRKLEVEIQLLPPRPAGRNPLSAAPERAGIYSPVVQMVAVVQVEGKRPRPAALESIFVHSDTAPGSHAGKHLGVFEPYLVAARRGLLAAVAESRRPASGSYEHIAPVVAPRAAEVGVAESEDEAVGVMIAAAAVPVARTGACVGAELNHSERGAGSGEGVSVGIGPHKRVNILGYGGQYSANGYQQG